MLLELQKGSRNQLMILQTRRRVRWGLLNDPGLNRQPAPRPVFLTLLYLGFIVYPVMTDDHWPESLFPSLSNREEKFLISHQRVIAHCPLPKQGVVNEKIMWFFCFCFLFFVNHRILLPQLLLSFLYFLNFYWCTVDLQCCVSFCCTAKWLLYIYIYPLIFRFLSHIGHYRVLSRVPCAIHYFFSLNAKLRTWHWECFLSEFLIDFNFAAVIWPSQLFPDFLR